MHSRQVATWVLFLAAMALVGCGGGGNGGGDGVVPRGFRVESDTPAALRVLSFPLPGSALTCTAFYGTDLTLVRWTSALPPVAELSPILFAARTTDNNLDIYMIAPDGSWIRPLTGGAVRGHHPSWSPDGTQLVFSRSPLPTDIWKMNAAGGDLTPVIETDEHSDAVAWSPDGRRIAFKHGVRGVSMDLYTATIRGTDWHQLTDSPYDDRGAEWSPDGSRLLFLSNRSGNYDIYTMNAADGKDVRRLTSDSAWDRAPAWHPDGDRILFVSNRDGDFDLYTMGVDGSNVTQVTNDPLTSGHPDYSPDGRKICYHYRSKTVSELRVANADGTDVETLVGDPYEVVCTAWAVGRSRRVLIGSAEQDAGYDPPLGDKIQAVVVVHDQRSIRSTVGIAGQAVQVSQPGSGQAAVDVQSSASLEVVESIWMGQPTTLHLRYGRGAEACRINFDPTTGQVASVPPR